MDETGTAQHQRPGKRPSPLRIRRSEGDTHSQNGSPLLAEEEQSYDTERSGSSCSSSSCGSPCSECEASTRKMTTSKTVSFGNGIGDGHDGAASTSRPGLQRSLTPAASLASQSSRERSPASTSTHPQASSSTSASRQYQQSTQQASNPHPAPPLPSPSVVQINQSLEESLRRAEEERQRRSAERRALRRQQKRRLKQQDQSQQDYHDSPASTQGTSVLHEEPEDVDTSGMTSLDINARSESIGGNEVESGSDEGEDYDSDDDEGYDGIDEGEYEDEDGRSLTRQLAETAVSVREMSRELGRARVKSNIQSILIVTKARDNQLIKLTRELALHLMKLPRQGKGGRGLTVYVDAQLKKSKRFDAAGIERDNPELFRSPHHHHHHHHHSHHNSQSGSVSNLAGMTNAQSGSSSGPLFQRRPSRRSSNSASSLNLLGMQTATPGNVSGSSTPALATSSSHTNGSRPLTKLTEALVSRQIDRNLERRNKEANGYAATEGVSGQQTPTHAKSNSSANLQEENARPGDDQQGQLRYWTAEMCSKSPHLFDLVITVSLKSE